MTGEKPLFSLETEQRIYQIGGCRIGGQPGELPTVLIGNLFNKGMPEVTDHKRGSFDRKRVSRLVELAETLSARTGVPHLVDLMAMYPKAMANYITFTSEESDAPFLVDGANKETRMAGLDTVKQLGLEERVICNGITPETTPDELLAIGNSGIKAAVVMAHNQSDYSPEGRISILEDSAGQMGLLNLARKAGIEKPLVDTVVFDVPSISFAAEAIRLVKEKLGQPAGCSPANATYMWKQGLKGSSMAKGFAASNASAHTVAQCLGADFLIYGPIKQAENMIPACAISDAIIAYHAMKRHGIKPLVKDHPLFRIF